MNVNEKRERSVVMRIIMLFSLFLSMIATPLVAQEDDYSRTYSTTQDNFIITEKTYLPPPPIYLSDEDAYALFSGDRGVVRVKEEIGGKIISLFSFTHEQEVVVKTHEISFTDERWVVTTVDEREEVVPHHSALWMLVGFFIASFVLGLRYRGLDWKSSLFASTVPVGVSLITAVILLSSLPLYVASGMAFLAALGGLSLVTYKYSTSTRNSMVNLEFFEEVSSIISIVAHVVFALTIPVFMGWTLTSGRTNVFIESAILLLLFISTFFLVSRIPRK